MQNQVFFNTTNYWMEWRKEGIKSLTNNSYPEFTKFPRPNLCNLFKRRHSIPLIDCSACRHNLFVVARTHRIQYVSVSLPSHDIHHQQIRRKNEENAIKRAVLWIPTSIQLTRADSYDRHRVEAEQWAVSSEHADMLWIQLFWQFSMSSSYSTYSGHDTKWHFEHVLSSRLLTCILYRVRMWRNSWCSDVETVCGSPIGKWRYWLTVLLSICNRRSGGYPLGVFWRCDGRHNAIGILGNMESENWIFCSGECASE